MAKKTGDDKADGDDKSPRFEVQTPNVGFNGDRLGVRFRDGAGQTDDEDVAEALLGIGYEVTDRRSGKVRGTRKCRFTVKAADGFSGDVLGVRFRDGKAGVDEPDVARTFRDRGYEVEESKADGPK